MVQERKVQGGDSTVSAPEVIPYFSAWGTIYEKLTALLENGHRKNPLELCRISAVSSHSSLYDQNGVKLGEVESGCLERAVTEVMDRFGRSQVGSEATIVELLDGTAEEIQEFKSNTFNDKGLSFVRRRRLDPTTDQPISTSWFAHRI